MANYNHKKMLFKQDIKIKNLMKKFNKNNPNATEVSFVKTVGLATEIKFKKHNENNFTIEKIR